MENAKQMDDNIAAALAALETGVANKEQLKAAIPVLEMLQQNAKSMAAIARSMTETAAKLSAACAKYALAHPEHVFGETLSVAPSGAISGDMEIDGRTFHFTHGFDGYAHIDPARKMTQEFLANLPCGWTKRMLKLDVAGVKKSGPSDDELASRGLVRKVADAWSERQTPPKT
ncbi:MAG: hypothetical protein II649_00480 [Kiritimatiellae bacterium]|nr:hypothetical protein [Kiritimatiellia bacterium]